MPDYFSWIEHIGCVLEAKHQRTKDRWHCWLTDKKTRSQSGFKGSRVRACIAKLAHLAKSAFDHDDECLPSCSMVPAWAYLISYIVNTYQISDNCHITKYPYKTQIHFGGVRGIEWRQFWVDKRISTSFRLYSVSQCVIFNFSGKIDQQSLRAYIHVIQ